MGNNWTTIVALSQQENRGPNRLMGFEKLNTETAKTRERATPERAMIPSNEFIYIKKKEEQKGRNRGRGGTRGAAASSVGATAGQRTDRGKGMGRRQDRRIFF